MSELAMTVIVTVWPELAEAGVAAARRPRAATAAPAITARPVAEYMGCDDSDIASPKGHKFLKRTCRAT
ncbi:hypothetical protein Mco01_22140 [Microbispora corallina]|uniref:Transposase n=1 Tax=Microbispora corallina TaxID=83302 RepID=A0ABQ4FWM6_9ACTN|nr:hypothetical protein Mco01_22140 [Microbispora corallina]